MELTTKQACVVHLLYDWRHVRGVKCVCVLTEGLCSGGAGRWEVLCEVDIAHVAATAAEVVRPVLDLWREVRHHAAVVLATLVVAQVSPAT